jgi:uncharacterized repeat protein (TIGR03806 family)
MRQSSLVALLTLALGACDANPALPRVDVDAAVTADTGSSDATDPDATTPDADTSPTDTEPADAASADTGDAAPTDVEPADAADTERSDADAEPSDTDPADSDTADTDPTDSDTADTDPTDTDTADTDTEDTDTADADPADSDAGADVGVDVPDTSEGPFGLETRPVNTTCVAPPRPSGEVDVELTRAFPALSFSFPTVLVRTDGDPGHWYVGEKSGTIRRFADLNSATSSTVVLNITSRVSATANEAGLLGVAFHPDYPTDPSVFVSYTTTVGRTLTSRVSRFSGDGVTIDPTSETVLLEFAQPASNHNGGHIAFGPDGYLYAGFGDGGGGGDPFFHGQNPNTWFGALLRLDVDSNAPDYAIPPTNPFVVSGGAPEVYAWGLRNPWRFSFDRASGELWVADVGQDAWEEVHTIDAPGGNYGWPIYEGFACYNGDARCGVVDAIDPVVVYDHSQGESITGGFVYRGASIPELAGRYVFADYTSGRVWAVGADADGQPTPERLFDSGLNPVTFGESEDGELLMMDIVRGTIHRLERRGAPPVTTFPERLSETGCMDPADPREPGSMLIPYAPNAPFWSDGAEKRRWFALPEGTQIETDDRGDFLFPLGSVLVKSFALDGQTIETRLMILHEDGVWAGYTYRWNEEQTEAFLLPAGEEREVGGQTWVYPSRAECLACHTSAAERSLGLEVLQLNGDWAYPSGVVANQLDTLVHIGALDLPASARALPGLVDPFDTSAPLAERARAYLHTNCASCHQAGGPGRGNQDFHYLAPAMNVCGAVPEHGTLGYDNPRLVAARDPDNSVLLGRVDRRDRLAMPPIGSTVVDAPGVALLSAWIASDVCDGVLPPEACANGIDDDENGAVDCLDALCVDAPGCSETTLSCSAPGTVTTASDVTGTTAGQPNAATGAACSQSSGGEAVYRFDGAAGTYCASTVGSSYDTVLHVRSACNVPSSELACNDDRSGGGLTSEVTFTTDGATPVWIFVDGYDGNGAYRLAVSPGGC